MLRKKVTVVLHINVFQTMIAHKFIVILQMHVKTTHVMRDTNARVNSYKVIAVLQGLHAYEISTAHLSHVQL